MLATKQQNCKCNKDLPNLEGTLGTEALAVIGDEASVEGLDREA